MYVWLAEQIKLLSIKWWNIMWLDFPFVIPLDYLFWEVAVWEWAGRQQTLGGEINRALPVASELPRWLSSKESACQAGGTGGVSSVPRSGRSSGAGNGNPLQYSCLENSIDRRAWWDTVHGVTESRTWLIEHPRQKMERHPMFIEYNVNTVKMAILAKATYRYYAISIKIL